MQKKKKNKKTKVAEIQNNAYLTFKFFRKIKDDQSQTTIRKSVKKFLK